MKFALTLLTFLSSTSVFAGNLYCVSNDDHNEQIIIQGQLNQGNVLAIHFQERGENQNLEILVNSIKPFNEFVEIAGIAKNRLFVGGGQMKFQLILPFKEASSATLRTVTPMFNKTPVTQEVPLACQIQNLYQIPPSTPVLATM